MFALSNHPEITRDFSLGTSSTIMRFGDSEEKMIPLDKIAEIAFGGINKNYIRHTEKSGGVAQAYCHHGIWQAIKPMLLNKGPSQYTYLIKSMSYQPPIIVCDIVPQVAAHTDVYYPETFGPHGGSR